MAPEGVGLGPSSEEVGQKLNEMITFIMPAFDFGHSSRYLARALAYYRTSGMRIIVLDGAEDSRQTLVDEVAGPEVTYLHLPGRSLLDRLGVGVDQVTTPYIKMLSQDDFFLPSGIDACLAFLEGNPDYTCAWGLSLAYQEADLNVNYFFLDSWARQYDNHAGKPMDRVRYFFENCSYHCTYGVFRVSAFRTYVALVQQAPMQFNLFERIGFFAISAAGGTRCLNTPFGIFESRDDSEGSKSIPLHLLTGTPDHEALMEKFHGVLASFTEVFPMDEGQDRAGYQADLFRMVSRWYSEVLPQKWAMPKLYSSSWSARTLSPQFRFEPEQFTDCHLYSPSFFRELGSIDRLIRVHGLCEDETYQKLDGVIERINLLFEEGRLNEAEMALGELLRVAPFHWKTLGRLKHLYFLQRRYLEAQQIAFWTNTIKTDAGLVGNLDPALERRPPVSNPEDFTSNPGD